MEKLKKKKKCFKSINLKNIFKKYMKKIKKLLTFLTTFYISQKSSIKFFLKY